MNKAASALGKMAKGIKKTLTDEQREAQRQRLAAAREKRWKTPPTPQNSEAKAPL